MDSPATNVKIFNNKLLDFVDDLRHVVGHLPEYGLLRTGARMLSETAPAQNQVLFDKYVAAPYLPHILEQDSTFFMQHDSYEIPQTAANAGIVPILKQVWRGLTDKDQTMIWRHLKLLAVLNSRCGGVQLPASQAI